MSKAPCGKMPCIWASLSVAATKLKAINTDNETANSLLFELETAVHLADSLTKYGGLFIGTNLPKEPEIE